MITLTLTLALGLMALGAWAARPERPLAAARVRRSHGGRR